MSGSNPRLRDLLPDALATASEVAPGAFLVRVAGFGVDGTGRAALSRADSFVPRWEFAFYDLSGPRHVTITWLSDAADAPRPNVDLRAGNVTTAAPIELALIALPDSDVIAGSFADACGAQLTGADDDHVILHRLDGEDVVDVGNGDRQWRGALGSLETVFKSPPD
jgi:hypothetical protein